MNEAKYKKIIAKIKNLLIVSEDMVNVFVAIILVGVVVILSGKIFFTDIEPTVSGILNLLNDALLILIIKELLWTVIRFLGRHRFNIESYLFVGIIAGIRKILSLEANSSFYGKSLEMTQIVELGAMAGIVLILSISYLMIKKADSNGRRILISGNRKRSIKE